MSIDEKTMIFDDLKLENKENWQYEIANWSQKNHR